MEVVYGQYNAPTKLFVRTRSEMSSDSCESLDHRDPPLLF